MDRHRPTLVPEDMARLVCSAFYGGEWDERAEIRDGIPPRLLAAWVIAKEIWEAMSVSKRDSLIVEVYLLPYCHAYCIQSRGRAVCRVGSRDIRVKWWYVHAIGAAEG